MTEQKISKTFLFGLNFLATVPGPLIDLGAAEIELGGEARNAIRCEVGVALELLLQKVGLLLREAHTTNQFDFIPLRECSI